jgi:hypothetical protein
MMVFVHNFKRSNLMSEFKNALAVTAVSGTLALGSFVASQEMSASYHEAENNCDAQSTPDLVKTCHERLEGDESGTLESLGVLGFIGVLAGGWRAIGTMGEKD